MLYIELYLCGYLSEGGDRERETELWGKERGEHFYICHIRTQRERRSYEEAHMQYLGNFLKLEMAGDGRVILSYRRMGEVCRREAAVYVAKDTKQIEHFLIRERMRAGRAAADGSGRERAESRGKLILETTLWTALVFLAVNMIEALSSYRNIREVIRIVELLSK